jgi:hypothetical protein
MTTTGTKAAMAVAGIVMLLVGVTSGFFGWMMWALALNGFMGQQRAVDTSMTIYFVLAILSVLIVIVLSVLSVYFLAGRRAWNAALAAALSITVFSVAVGALHVGAVVVSAVVANQLRTNR